MESIENKAKVARPRKSGKAERTENTSPAESGKPRGRKKFDIDIFRGWCKCCGICSSFCPRECIRPDEEGAPVADSSQCTGCRWCELHCPDFAISIRENDLDSENTCS